MLFTFDPPGSRVKLLWPKADNKENEGKREEADSLQLGPQEFSTRVG